MKHIKIPRHRDLGITVTIVIDAGTENYVIKQDIIPDAMLKDVHFLDDVLKLYLEKNSRQVIEYMKQEGFIKQYD